MTRKNVFLKTAANPQGEDDLIENRVTDGSRQLTDEEGRSEKKADSGLLVLISALERVIFISLSLFLCEMGIMDPVLGILQMEIRPLQRLGFSGGEGVA